jgi:hypothetical protein
MAKKYQVHVFGKKGCDKCAILNQRLDKLLAEDSWSDFEKCYNDVETSDGIIRFCEAECINPQRIPAMIVLQKEEDGAYVPVPNPTPGKADKVYKKSKLYQFLGLQTDYTDAGKGVISPKMIKSCLEEARTS